MPAKTRYRLYREHKYIFTFLNDIKDCEPQKFEQAWSGICSFL